MSDEVTLPMIQRIQQRPRGQRVIIFILFILVGILLIALLAAGFFALSLNTGRDQSLALAEGLTLREFAVLPDDDAYPPAVAVGPDGRVYTGSFVSGTLWTITPDAELTEMPGTREAIGAVSGLTVAPDGTLYVVDQTDADLTTFSGDIKRIAPDGAISLFATINDERGFLLPDDIALDSTGRVYVTDRGRGEIWRFEPDGSGGIAWWTPPDSETPPVPTGLAYDSASDTLLLTDSKGDRVYRIHLSSAAAELLYDHQGLPHAPGFDGITTSPEGRIFIAALAQNGLVELKDGELVYLAGVFRGISDLDYFENRLYATNFDSFSLVVPLVRPRLPFALDLIVLPDS